MALDDSRGLHTVWNVTDAFLDEARSGNARQVSYLEVVLEGEPQGDPIETESVDINVRLDAATRRSGSFNALDELGSLWPATEGARFSPWGVEVRVRTGFRFSDDTEELVPVAVLRLTEMSEDGLGAVPTSGYDRSINVQPDAPEPYVLPSGITIDTAVGRVLLNRYPGAELSAVESRFTIPPMLLPYGEDHWGHLLDLAAAGGHDLAPNGDGVFQLRDTVEDDTRVVAYVEGKDNVAFELVRELSADPREVPNGIVVVGSNSRLETDVLGQAWDEDPTSPTRKDGPYGNHARVVSDDKVMSNLQAEYAAKGILRRVLGSQQRLTMSAPLNPAHDVGDVVEVVYESRGIEGQYVIDELDFSTDPSQPMRVGLRRRVLT